MLLRRRLLQRNPKIKRQRHGGWLSALKEERLPVRLLVDETYFFLFFFLSSSSSSN